MVSAAPPPMKSQYTTAPTDYELKALRHAERNEKARLRMARCVAFFSPEFVFIYTRKRAEPDTGKGTNKIYAYGKLCVVATGNGVYKAKFGPEAYAAWRKTKHDRKRRTRAKLRAKEAYHSGDEAEASVNAHDGCSLMVPSHLSRDPIVVGTRLLRGRASCLVIVVGDHLGATPANKAKTASESPASHPPPPNPPHAWANCVAAVTGMLGTRVRCLIKFRDVGQFEHMGITLWNGLAERLAHQLELSRGRRPTAQ
ncbi:hypothetical protein B0H14DRAFT_3533722 [Mycena olivaceomarginata]|nr:hypothetical protein B0H14DRAFT_3533722 [Mycena olivaceomarginata]